MKVLKEHNSSKTSKIIRPNADAFLKDNCFSTFVLPENSLNSINVDKVKINDLKNKLTNSFLQ